MLVVASRLTIEVSVGELTERLWYLVHHYHYPLFHQGLVIAIQDFQSFPRVDQHACQEISVT